MKSIFQLYNIPQENHKQILKMLSVCCSSSTNESNGLNHNPQQLHNTLIIIIMCSEACVFFCRIKPSAYFYFKTENSFRRKILRL